MTDATSRARAHEVVAGLFLGREIEDLIERPMSDYDRAAYLGGLFAREGLAIIDARTHAAIPREPSDEVVERVAREMCALVHRGSRRFYDEMTESGRNIYRFHARAAIAALVGTQTQGGEPDAPP